MNDECRDCHDARFGPTGSTVGQHYSLPFDRRGAEGQQRPPGSAAGRRTHGLCAVDAVSATQSSQPAMVQPGPLRPVSRPRFRAALQPAASHRIRRAAGADQTVPAVGQPDTRSSRARDAAGRGDHHGAAGPGVRQRRRHGHRGSLPGRALQPARLRDHRSFHLRPGQRRRPDGGRGRRSGFPGRPLETGRS